MRSAFPLIHPANAYQAPFTILGVFAAKFDILKQHLLEKRGASQALNDVMILSKGKKTEVIRISFPLQTRCCGYPAKCKQIMEIIFRK